jgi:hypothetical protein
MKIRRIGLIAGAMLAATGFSANAASFDFDWSFSASGISGGGTLTADQDPVNLNTFTITSISGAVNGDTISGPTDFYFPDQLIFYPNPPNVVVDTNGFAFGIGDGSNSYNIYENVGFDPGSVFDCGALYCLAGSGPTDNSNFPADPITALDTLTLQEINSVPEPATWAMMIVGFAGLGFAAYRRRWSAVA